LHTAAETPKEGPSSHHPGKIFDFRERKQNPIVATCSKGHVTIFF